MVLLPLLASNDCLFNTLILGVVGWGVFFVCVCVLWGLYWRDYKNMHIKHQFYNVNQNLAHKKNKKQNKQKISPPKPTPFFSYLGEGKRNVYESWPEKFWRWKHWRLLMYSVGDWLTKTSCNSILNCWKRISLFRIPQTKSISVSFYPCYSSSHHLPKLRI